MAFVEGTIIEKKLSYWGGSLALIIDKDLRDYLKVEEGDVLVIKCEKSKTWGSFIGVGKKGKH